MLGEAREAIYGNGLMPVREIGDRLLEQYLKWRAANDSNAVYGIMLATQALGEKNVALARLSRQMYDDFYGRDRIDNDI